MSLTLAATLLPQHRAHAARACLVLMLAGAMWFVAGARSFAIDPDAAGQMRLDEAASDLRQASENVEQARGKAVAARERLDAFLAEHFDPQRVDDSRDSEPSPEAGDDAIEMQSNPALERGKTQLQELLDRRDELMGYLTESHPEVAEVDGRIASIQERISILAGAALDAERQGHRQKSEATRHSTESADRLQQSGEQDGAEYQVLLDQWQSAHRALSSALAAEKVAQRRLQVSILSQPKVDPSATQASGDLPGDEPSVESQHESATTSAQSGAGDSGPMATGPGGPPSDTSSSGSQPLALAALLIALAVAALAAVRLARSTANPVFASVDEVATALAMPVVGIVPASAARRPVPQSGTSSRKNWIVFGQLLFAACVFAAVAFGVQNPGDLWRHCTDPLQALGSLAQAMGGGN